MTDFNELTHLEDMIMNLHTNGAINAETKDELLEQVDKATSESYDQGMLDGKQSTDNIFDKMEENEMNTNLDGILCTALEGGINYWCDKAEVVDGDYKGAKFASDCVSRGGSIKFHIIDEEDEAIRPEILTKELLIKGIRMAANYRGKTVERFLDDVPDAGEADMVIQFAVFGELIFA